LARQTYGNRKQSHEAPQRLKDPCCLRRRLERCRRVALIVTFR
jgi:hypothetical protein